jgi:hypothetical protein
MTVAVWVRHGPCQQPPPPPSLSLTDHTGCLARLRFMKWRREERAGSQDFFERDPEKRDEPHNPNWMPDDEEAGLVANADEGASLCGHRSPPGLLFDHRKTSTVTLHLTTSSPTPPFSTKMSSFPKAKWTSPMMAAQMHNGDRSPRN